MRGAGRAGNGRQAVSIYRVEGRRRYRDHEPGQTFEAELDPAAEERALARGDIALLVRSRTQLAPGSYRLPAGWDIESPTTLEE